MLHVFYNKREKYPLFTNSILSNIMLTIPTSLFIHFPGVLFSPIIFNLSKLLCFRYISLIYSMVYVLWAKLNVFLLVHKLNLFTLIDMTDVLSYLWKIYVFYYICYAFFFKNICILCPLNFFFWYFEVFKFLFWWLSLYLLVLLISWYFLVGFCLWRSGLPLFVILL